MTSFIHFLLGFLYCLAGFMVLLRDLKVTKTEKGKNDPESDPIEVLAVYLTALVVLVFWPIILIYDLLFPIEQ